MSALQTVMIVDDDLNVLEVLEARLLSNGFQVHKAVNGQQAMNLLKSQPIDLLISDMKMPGMSGMDLFHEVRCLLLSKWTRLFLEKRHPHF